MRICFVNYSVIIWRENHNVGCVIIQTFRKRPNMMSLDGIDTILLTYMFACHLTAIAINSFERITNRGI